MYIRSNASTATPFGFGPLEMAFDTINNILQVAESTGMRADNEPVPRGGSVVDKSVNLINSNARSSLKTVVARHAFTST
jgi:hypothetical protein